MLSLSVLEKTFGRWGQHFFWVLHWGCSRVWDWWPKFQAISHSWWHCKSWQAEIFKKMHCCIHVLAFKGWINDWLLQVRHLWSPNCTTTTVTPLCGPISRLVIFFSLLFLVNTQVHAFITVVEVRVHSKYPDPRRCAWWAAFWQIQSSQKQRICLKLSTFSITIC